MTDDERKRRLDGIRKHADWLHEVARRYDRLRWLAERGDCSEAFLDLAEAAGAMSIDSLRQTGTLLEMLHTAFRPTKEPKP